MKHEEYFNQAELLKEKLYRTAFLYLGSKSAAIDAVDEAVYKGYLSYKKLKQAQYFSTWLMRILINLCNDELRRRKRECTVATLPESAVEDYDALPLKKQSSIYRKICAALLYSGISAVSPSQKLPTL